MRRAFLILCVLFLACDRADELLIAGLLEAFAEAPAKPGEHAADCAKGADQYLAPNVLRTINCNPIDAGRSK